MQNPYIPHILQAAIYSLYQGYYYSYLMLNNELDSSYMSDFFAKMLLI